MVYTFMQNFIKLSAEVRELSG